MLTISGYKKLEGLVLKDSSFNGLIVMNGLKIQTINEFGDRYSIWLSDKTNIEIDRNRHWKGGNYTYYKMYMAGKGTTNAMTEFIMIQTINTLDRMTKHLIYIHEKYKTK
jgi:hypothetical protein